MNINVENIISGIAVELAKLCLEEIRKTIKNQNNPKKSKKRRTRMKRKKNSNDK